MNQTVSRKRSALSFVRSNEENGTGESVPFIQGQFFAARSHFYETLKAAYLNSVEKAADKVYAAEFYQRIYFSNNTKLPHWSVAYRKLVAALNHSRKFRFAGPS
jgi:hypothetical protein